MKNEFIQKSTPITGWEALNFNLDNHELKIGDFSVMMDWEVPIMEKTAELLKLENRHNLLEIGFGMGISAEIFSQIGFYTHTIVEPHPQVLELAQNWVSLKQDKKIFLINDYWQNLKCIKKFDCIYFDSFSLTQEALIKERLHFIDFASQYLLLERNSSLSIFMLTSTLEEIYQTRLLSLFNEIKIKKVELSIPSHIVIPELKSKNEVICFVASR